MNFQFSEDFINNPILVSQFLILPHLLIRVLAKFVSEIDFRGMQTFSLNMEEFEKLTLLKRRCHSMVTFKMDMISVCVKIHAFLHQK